MQFIKTFLAKKNSNVPVIFLPLVLWFLLWATYNTDITRFFDPNTPRNFLAFFHQVRSFLPFLSLLLGILILRKHKFTINFFKGPLGFLTLYTLVGILASALSLNVWFSFYWGILYVTGILVLWVVFLKRGVDGLKNIFYFNFFIAGFLALMLAGMFFARAGSFSWLTLIQFLQGHRPFEGINNLGAQVITLGMAGTRPTGLGRYAGLATLLCLPLFWHHLKKYRILAYIFFPIFLSILIFSRARTSAVALVLAIILMLFFRSQSKINFLFILTAIALILSVIGFFPIFFSYLNNESFLPGKEQFNNQNSKVQLFLQEKIIENEVILPENSSNYSSSESVGTLSGRTTGIWPESWKLFLTSPIIGRGFFADRIFLQGQHAHNLILQALVQSGALGTLFFLISLFLAWLLAIKLWFKNQSDAILLSAIGMLAYFTMRGITESFVFFGADYLFMVPIFAYLQFYLKT